MNEPEYVGREYPERLFICGRCKRGVLVFLGAGDSTVYRPSADRRAPWCYVCGSRQGGAEYTLLGMRIGHDAGATMQTGVPDVRIHEGL